MPNLRRIRPASPATSRRKTEIIELRSRGKSYGQIARQVNVSKTWVATVVTQELTALADIRRDFTEQQRALENLRLDRLLDAVWPQAMDGDVDAIEAAIKISARRSKLLGPDAPTKVAATNADGMSNPYLGMSDDQLFAELQEVLGTHALARLGRVADGEDGDDGDGADDEDGEGLDPMDA